MVILTKCLFLNYLSFREDDSENCSEDDSRPADLSDDIKMDALLTSSTKCTLYFPSQPSDLTNFPPRFNKEELSDRIRNLNFSKQSSELLASQAQKNNFWKTKLVSHSTNFEQHHSSTTMVIIL